jgi:tetratricopeptide (TPR) repeat protein
VERVYTPLHGQRRAWKRSWFLQLSRPGFRRTFSATESLALTLSFTPGSLDDSPMPEVPLTSLDVRLQKQVENAQVALQRGNFDYVIEVTSQVLKHAPACLPVRRLQRVALVKHHESKNKIMAKALGSVTMAGFMFSNKKDPVKAMESAEKLLVSDPNNIAALKSLSEAAVAQGLMETAAFAWECIREAQPRDHDTLVHLAEAYIAAKQFKEAVRVADDLLKVRPQDGDALALMRKASVAQTMDKGNWETQSSFREKLKDEKLATSLEQASKVVTSSEMTERLVAEAKQRLAAEPQNLNHYRAIIDGYRRLNDPASALEYVKQARLIPSAAGDATLEKLQSDLHVAVLEDRVKTAQDYVNNHPSDEAATALLATVKAELSKVRLDEARAYVERYPNDYAAKFTLANLLFEVADYNGATANYQQAQKNPKVRLAALAGMGKTLKARKMFDLAIQQFQTAKAEIPVMDDLKKDIIYQLAECYEGLNRPEDAIAEYKLIYSDDIGFRDVADKINAFYSSR